MSLNLINDAWIPVRCQDGSRRTIAPWEMADDAIIAPDWPRPDLNIACYEMLIGLVYLADPPAHIDDWGERSTPNPTRLREKLALYAPAFNLLGEGPLFLQDYEAFGGEGNGVDMLFIDSAGENAAKKNADVMVHRHRYGPLDLPLAAMALYTFQNFAPSGGAGNRTSMRGGGPLVTLVTPKDAAENTLWSVVWANVPYGRPSDMRELPWMRATRVSPKIGQNEGLETFPPTDRRFGVEAFFGLPRRLRLVEKEGQVIDVVQKPSGTNYKKWMHPLSPYYCKKVGAEWLPIHPRAGRFGYPSWLGIVASKAGDNPLSELALTLQTSQQRIGDCHVIVAGWAMEPGQMKPLDFTLSIAPHATLSQDQDILLQGLIEAADAAASALRGALEPVLKGGEEREAQREVFFLETETRFRAHVEAIKAGKDPRADWLTDLRGQALKQFDDIAMPELERMPVGLSEKNRQGTKIEPGKMAKIVTAHKWLSLAFLGHGDAGKKIFTALGLEAPTKKKGKAV